MSASVIVKVASCNLNQWAMSFDDNLARTRESIREAKRRGARFRLGPELELSGYGCEDHFLEQDTFRHSWESVAALLSDDTTDGIVCDVGVPALHRGVRYNCRVLLLDRKVLYVRPKMDFANDGNYRESRWFTPWPKGKMYDVEHFSLPAAVRAVTKQREVPFGVCILELNDTSIAVESCEELFTPLSPHILLGLDGAEIIANGSGSHHTLRKLNQRLDLIVGATSKVGGVYLYANQQGCDGGRLYYDGCALVSANGKILVQGSQFSVADVEVVVATVDLEDVRAYRASVPSRGQQASASRPFQRVRVDFDLGGEEDNESMVEATRPMAQPRIHAPEEEIALGPACWLWDYLRRSGGGGFFLPLSGGADSSSTAAIVGNMCQLVVRAVGEGNARVLRDVRRLVRDEAYTPKDSRDLAGRIFHTCYMGTEKNSSAETRARAKKLASEIGSYHLDMNIDTMISAITTTFTALTGKTPKYKVHGGTNAENLALQNIQARMRMVFGYMLAQLLPWVRGQSGWLLVLGSANVDEALRGYMTKYDCSSADINPIGGISKTDLKRFMRWAATNLGYPSLTDVVEAPPTAELEPITDEYKQSDEDDMGMTYEELSYFGRLRKLALCGPVSMFQKLRHVWTDLSPNAVAEKVKRFFFYYSINRHKLTTLTPSYHAENYSPDDNRYDHRQFLYDARWSRQFATVDRLASKQANGSSSSGDGEEDDEERKAKL